MRNLLLFFALVLLAACQRRNITGTWEDYIDMYVFNSDNTGMCNGALGNYPFTWELNDDSLIITMDIDGRFTYDRRYKIKSIKSEDDRETMTLLGDGRKTKLWRVK